MMKKVLTTVAIAGALGLGTVSAAGAATTPGGANASRCAHASQVLSHLGSLQQRGEVFLHKAELREQQALSGGHQALATNIEKRIVRIQRIESRLRVLAGRIRALCPTV